MKCPKCGFVSFEYLVECKGCSTELKSHKDEYEIYMDEPQMLPILAYYNQQNESRKDQEEAEINRLHEGQGTAVAEEEFAGLEAQPFQEETVSLGDLTEEEGEKDVDLSATEVPDLEDIQLKENVEDIDLSAISEEEETVDLELGEETAETEGGAEEISLDLAEENAEEPVALEMPPEPVQEEEVLSLSDLTGEDVEDEEISLDLGVDLEESPQEKAAAEDIPLEEINLEEPVEEIEIGEVTLEEPATPAPTEEDVENIDLSTIEEAEDISLSLSLDEEEEEPQKAEPTPHRGDDEEVVTLDDLLVEGDGEDNELSLGVEEFDLKDLETEISEKTTEKAPEAPVPQFETGGIELSLEDNGDAAKRAEELKKKEQENKSFDDLDIDLKLELE